MRTARRTLRRGRAGHRNRHSRNGSGHSRTLKIAMMAVIPALALGAGGYGLSEYTKIEKISADYCYEREDQAQTAVFLDYSVNKDLTGAQRRDLVTALEREYAALPVNGRVMVFTTSRDTGGSIARPDFEICRPATSPGEQQALGAPAKPAPNLRRIAEDAKARFSGEVARILSDTQDDSKAAQESPLLEQVRAISRYPGFQGRTRRLVFLSDGLQNSDVARFGAVRGDMPSVSKFVRRPDYDVIRPDSLSGVDVTVLLVESIALPQPGLDYVTHNEMRRWWPAFFKENGAASVRLERLRRVAGS